MKNDTVIFKHSRKRKHCGKEYILLTNQAKIFLERIQKNFFFLSKHIGKKYYTKADKLLKSFTALQHEDFLEKVLYQCVKCALVCMRTGLCFEKKKGVERYGLNTAELELHNGRVR